MLENIKKKGDIPVKQDWLGRKNQDSEMSSNVWYYITNIMWYISHDSKYR